MHPARRTFLPAPRLIVALAAIVSLHVFAQQDDMDPREREIREGIRSGKIHAMTKE